MKIDIQDPSKLISDGDQISSISSQLKREIDKIYQVVDDLKSSWAGESSQRFTQNIEGYRGDFEKLAQALGEFGSLVSAVGKDYQELESSL